MRTPPQGWTLTSLGDVISIRNGYAFKSADFRKHGVPVVRQSNLTGNFVDLSDCAFVPPAVAKDASRFVVKRGDILVGMSGSIGEPSVYPYDFEAVQNQRTGLVEFFVDDSGHREFIRQTLIAFELEYTNRGKGIGVQNVSAKDIQSTEIPLPPLAEQRRIVTKIDSLSAKSKRARDQLDHIPRLVEKYKQAILAAAFRGELTGEVHAFDRRPLGTLASLITKGASPKWQGFEYVEKGTLFIRSQNVGWGELLLDDRAYLPPEFEAKHRRSTIRSGDVLLNIVGASIGRPAVATSQLEGANCNQAVSIIRLADKGAAPSFLCYWLLSEEAQSTIASGTVDFARANFSLGDIRDLQVPWPGAEKRAEIVQRIQTAFAWIARLATEATSARKLIGHLDQAILAKAFRGELVPQDPNDEPASVLLERIRAERTQNPANGLRGRRRLA